MKHRLRPAVVLIVLAGLLVGCGSDGGGGGGTGMPELGPSDLIPDLPPAPPDPCTLVTTEEASAALGVPTKDCEVLGQDEFYATARFLPDGTPGAITLDIGNGGQTQYDAFREQAQGDTEFADVPGVGDAAYFDRPASSAIVTFLKGPYVVTVSVGFAIGPPTQESAVTLAQQAAARITT